MHTFRFIINFIEAGIYQVLLRDNDDNKTIMLYSAASNAAAQAAVTGYFALPGSGFSWVSTGNTASYSSDFTFGATTLASIVID